MAQRKKPQPPEVVKARDLLQKVAAKIELPEEEETLLSRPSSFTGQLQRVSLVRLREHEDADELHTTNRFVFYELEQDGLLVKGRPKEQRNDGQNLADATLHLREVELVPWWWIDDVTRSIRVWNFAESIADHLRDKVETFRLNLWGDELPPMLITESRSVQSILDDLAWEYLVPLAGTAGQAHGFLHTDVLPTYRRTRRVLYIGDLDHSGGHIEANTRRILEAAGGKARLWRRIAITERQRAALERQGKTPILKIDKRYLGGLPYEAWEAEALRQGEIVRITRAALDRLLPEPLEDVRLQEAAEIEAAVKRMRRWK